MKYSLKIIFGKEEVDKFISNIPLTKDELEINVKEFSFETELELIAFKKGINEAIGWQELYLLDND
ncbi:hypothetical protein C3L50_11835 [Flavobacterium alvei]|uniref:Uncharacterized protein n=1 Tax=Flavobacterium alvei TaxID=2080416 RepID=A0A2S5A8H9_9FLAO|nr:hypothetical protein [Flavobacterium alvei]POY38814.1 hypothetical protein C3L50_11835 [Flavobacterium alvei]